MLRPELTAVLGSERFVREIRTTAALQHAPIFGPLDSGDAGGAICHVDAVVDGETLCSMADIMIRRSPALRIIVIQNAARARPPPAESMSTRRARVARWCVPCASRAAGRAGSPAMLPQDEEELHGATVAARCLTRSVFGWKRRAPRRDANVAE